MNGMPVFRQPGRIWKKGKDAPWAPASQPKSPEKLLGDTLKPDVHDPVSAPVADVKPAENL